jgi:predicted XRE-type DNA-binding protein
MKAAKHEQFEKHRRRVGSSVRSVFYDLFEPDEAMVLEAKSTILHALEQWLVAYRMNRRKAAKLLQISDARVSELRCGRINRFSLDSLFRLAARASLSPEVGVGMTPRQRASRIKLRGSK